MKKSNTVVRLLEKELKRANNDLNEIQLKVNQLLTQVTNYKLEIHRLKMTKLEVEKALKDLND